MRLNSTETRNLKFWEPLAAADLNIGEAGAALKKKNGRSEGRHAAVAVSGRQRPCADALSVLASLTHTRGRQTQEIRFKWPLLQRAHTLNSFK